MIYLTGATNDRVEAVAFAWGLGLMAQPNNNTKLLVSRFPAWATDTGCFSPTGTKAFDVERYLGEYLMPLREHRNSCLFATAPDRLMDAEATLRLSLPILPRIRHLGFRAAFIAQDGLTAETTPWGAFDVLFIGGSTDFKMGEVAARISRTARDRGCWVHMGRVNSRKRLEYADSIGCESADGTFIKYGPDVNLPRIPAWFTNLHNPFAQKQETAA